MIWNLPSVKNLENLIRPSRVSFGRALLNPIVLVMVGIYLMQNFGNYGYLFWLPSALENARKMSNQLVGVLTAVPYILTAMGMILVSRHSDKHRERRGHVAFGLAWGGACMMACILADRPLLHVGFCGHLPGGRRILWNAGAVLGDSNGNSAALGFRICHGVGQCARQPGRVLRPAGRRALSSIARATSDMPLPYSVWRFWLALR